MNQSNLVTLPQSTVEDSLRRMKQLSEHIKVMEAEFNQLKSQVIDEYFLFNPEYCTFKGLLLASYKPQTMKQFQQKKFKEDHQNIYELYLEEKTIYKFLMK